ncbi:MAG: hypothetical protein KDN22_07960 [Verrucomicrobiae bacterium]|nr:hypothetical protein [Verrucomicrobiae bacterium]
MKTFPKAAVTQPPQCCEFMLTDEQAEQLPGAEPGQLLVGSIQRHCWPHPRAGEFFFRGRWMTGRQAQRLRNAAKKLSPKPKSKSNTK